MNPGHCELGTGAPHREINCLRTDNFEDCYGECTWVRGSLLSLLSIFKS